MRYLLYSLRIIYILFFLLIFVIMTEGIIGRSFYTPSRFIKVEPRGYVQFDLLLAFEYLYDIDTSLFTRGSNPSFYKLPLKIRGLSNNYAIDFGIELVSDFLHVSDYFRFRSDFVRSSEIYEYSFGNFDLSYLVFSENSIYLLLGGKFGHYGFLSPHIERVTYVISSSLITKVYWLVHPFFLVKSILEFEFPFYKKNIDSYITLGSNIEITFDILGNIANPKKKSFLYSIGLSLEKVWLNTKVNNLNLAQTTLTREDLKFDYLNIIAYLKLSFVY